MILIKNYADWISDELMEFLIKDNGDTVPVWQPDKWRGRPELDDARETLRPGYSHRNDVFQQFSPDTDSIKNIEISLPEIPNDNRKKFWWFIKLLPGQMQPMHFDPHLLDIKNPKRYTLFLQDWIPGHIFVYKDKYISNYKKGDLFLWEDHMMQHGVVNIGFTNRYTLQITTYDF